MHVDYVPARTGMLLPIVILEAGYKQDMTVKHGAKLVKKAILNSTKRDAMTGNGIDLLIITEDGSKEKQIEIQELGE